MTTTATATLEALKDELDAAGPESVLDAVGVLADWMEGENVEGARGMRWLWERGKRPLELLSGRFRWDVSEHWGESGKRWESGIVTDSSHKLRLAIINRMGMDSQVVGSTIRDTLSAAYLAAALAVEAAIAAGEIEP